MINVNIEKCNQHDFYFGLQNSKAIHFVCFTYDVILAGCSPKIKQSTNQRQLMLITLAYIMLFSHFWVACKNSELCYYIFSYNSLCRLYTMRKLPQEKGENAKKPQTTHSLQDMIRHIRLICEKVFLHFVTDLSSEQFFDKMSKEFFIWLKQFVRNSSPAIHYV